MRRRHHPRGTKRGRPRGSTRRGGGHGSLQRVPTPTSPAIGTSGTTASPLPAQQEAGGGGGVGAGGSPATAAAAASGSSVPQNEEGKWQATWFVELPALKCHLSLIAVIITFIALPFYISSASSALYYISSPFPFCGTARILYFIFMFFRGSLSIVRDNFSTAQNISIILYIIIFNGIRAPPFLSPLLLQSSQIFVSRFASDCMFRKGEGSP